MIPRVENRWCDASLLARASGDSRAVPHEQAAIFEENVRMRNIYMKRVNIDNSEFVTLLDQYDNLIKETDDKTTIFNAQKQVLSKYEELILQNG